MRVYRAKGIGKTKILNKLKLFKTCNANKSECLDRWIWVNLSSFPSRAKQKRWSGISWLCADVFLKRKVWHNFSSLGFPIFLCMVHHNILLSSWNPPVFLGKAWKLAQRSKSMTESVKRKCWHQLRYLIF